MHISLEDTLEGAKRKMEKFNITTPIYYINGEPHIGHAYTSIAVDILARFKRFDGFDVHLCTGTDEHGIKVARSAKHEGIAVEAFSDIMSQKFRDTADAINISYDDFVRTTEQRHIKCAQALWSMLKKEDVYKSVYSGWYSARDEEYIAEGDLDENGHAPSGASVEWMEEESYFFRLSAYQDKLLEWYETHPDFIAPASRRNEIISFVKSGLHDLSISRSQFSWGVPVPTDNMDSNGEDGMDSTFSQVSSSAAGASKASKKREHKHVMYVWIDALANYLTTFGFPDNKEYASEMMEHCIHIVGKEIIRFHTVYWPAFLMSAGIALPKRVYAHGWWTNEGMKMSKSIGNIVNPMDVISRYGLDVLRYFLFREIRFGEDGDFSEAALKNRFSYELANDLGNLIQRVLVFIQKREGNFVADYDLLDSDKPLFEKSRKIIENMRKFMDKQDIYSALNVVLDLVTEANRYVNDMKPWELAKKDEKRLNVVLTVLCESIRAIAFGFAPFMPDTCKKIFGFLKVEGKSFEEISQDFVNQKFPEPEVLFPKDK